jgi:hypothetical protein
MYAYRVETSVDKDGCLILKGLPFKAGDTVEVIILRNFKRSKKGTYPLRGKPIRYDNPTEPVAQSDWEALQ